MVHTQQTTVLFPWKIGRITKPRAARYLCPCRMRRTQMQPEHPQQLLPRARPPTPQPGHRGDPQALPYLALRELLQTDGTHRGRATAAARVQPLGPGPPATGLVPPGGQLADGPGRSLLEGILGRRVGLRMGKGPSSLTPGPQLVLSPRSPRWITWSVDCL